MQLIWMDLETTGLDPQKDRILEVAVAYSSLELPFAFAKAPKAWVLGTKEAEEEHFSPFIRDMHTKNRLLAECRRSAWRVEDVEEMLLADVPHVEDKEERPTLAGASVHFDLGFARVHMPRLAKRLSHRVLDTSAVRLFCFSMGMPRPVHIEGNHRAEDDVLESIDQLRACAHWLHWNGWQHREHMVGSSLDGRAHGNQE
jgi:oligoribonuclease